MKIKIEKGQPIAFFVRIAGPKGCHELKAVLDTGSVWCTIPTVDARELGYDAFFDPIANRGDGALALTQSGTFEVGKLKLQKVSVADISAENIDALVYELPRMAGADMILGLSFLERFRLNIDYAEGFLSLEKPIS